MTNRFAPATIEPAEIATPIPQQARTDDELVKLWLRRFKSRHTVDNYERRAREFRAQVSKPLASVILADVLDYLEGLSHQSVNTRANATAILKSLFGFAHSIGYVRFNVAAAIRIEQPRKSVSDRIVPEQKILEAIHGEPIRRNRLIMTLLYSGGVRVSELCGLRWRDLSEKGAAVILTVYGKGSKTRHVRLSEATSREFMLEREGLPDDAPLFLSQKGGPLTSRQVQRIVQRAGARVGLDNLSPHWFRHCHASHAIDRGAPVSLVKDTLGHASLATTSGYVHARPDDGSSRYLVI